MQVTHKITPPISENKMGDDTLTAVSHHPYLGIELSKDLIWVAHINQVSNKANRTMGLLQRNLYTCSQSVKENAYKSLVRPKLEYCSAVWDPHNKNTKTTLEKVQQHAARFLCNNYRHRASVKNMLLILGLDML